MKTRQQELVFVLQNLATEGIIVEYLDDLKKEPSVLREAASILIALLPKLEVPFVKGQVAALASHGPTPPAALVEELRPLAPWIVQEASQPPPKPQSALAWDLAEALTRRADESVYDDLVEIFRDSDFGTERQMLAYALARVKSRRADTIALLLEALGDRDVVLQCLDVLGNLKATEALPAVRELADSPDAHVKRMAAKVLKKLERAAGRQEPPPAAPPRPPEGFRLDGLEEASMNFDLENVLPFLRQVAELVKGLGEADLALLEARLNDMEPGEEESFYYEVQHDGAASPLLIRIHMSDVDAPDLYLFSRPPLAAALGETMDALME